MIAKIFQTGAMELEAGRSEVLSTATVDSIDLDTEIITTTAAHGLILGDTVEVSTTDTLPPPLVASTVYYVITTTELDELKLATNLNHALNGVAINITGAGVGTHTISKMGVASEGWGDAASPATLGAGDAFPWLTFSSKVTINTEEDNSITTKGFKYIPRMIGKMIENPLSFHARYKGLNKFHFWMFGYEHDPVKVVVLKSTGGFSAPPTPGNTYTDGTIADYVYLRTETVRVGNVTSYLYVFKSVTGVPATQTGTMTHDAITLAFTNHSGLMYEHTYELDSGARHFRNYTATEAAALADVDVADKRNLMCTLGKRLDGYDIRYQNAICKNFAYKITSAGLSSWEANYLAYTESRGDYSSSSWTLASGLADNQLVPAHFEHSFLIGTAYAIGAQGQLSGFSELGITNMDINIEVPMQSIQDFISGLSIAEPALEGKYGIAMNGTISRHSVSTYQGYRDAQTPIIVRLASNQGWYMQEWLVKTAVLSEAGPDDSNVAQEVLAINPGFVEGSHEWSTWLTSVTEIHQAPVIFRTRDVSSVNAMTAQ